MTTVFKPNLHTDAQAVATGTDWIILFGVPYLVCTVMNHWLMRLPFAFFRTFQCICHA